MSKSGRGINDSFMGMKEDIISALKRGSSLLSLIPGGREKRVRFLENVMDESRKIRKIPIFLGRRGDLDSIYETLRKHQESNSRYDQVSLIPSWGLSCHKEGIKIHVSDVAHHCRMNGGGGSCPHMVDFDLEVYREIKKNGGTTLAEEEDQIREAGMCPAKLSLDLAADSTVIVSEYTFLFNEAYEDILRSLDMDLDSAVIVIVDPDSFLESIRKRFSFGFSGEDLSLEGLGLDEKEDDFISAFNIIFQILRDLLTYHSPDKPIERRRLIESYRQMSITERVGVGLQDIHDRLSAVLMSGEIESIKDFRRIRSFYYFLSLWLNQYSSVSRHIRAEGEVSEVSLTVIDPEVITVDILRECHSLIMTGETLYPHDLFSYMLGLRLDRVINRTYIDPEQMSDQMIVSISNVDTSYKQRSEEQYRRILEDISEISKLKRGVTLAIFSSYSIMEKTKNASPMEPLGKDMISESRDLSRIEREGIPEDIDELEDVLVMAVQNGTVVSAFKRGEITPQCVIVVGLQLIPPSPETNQMKFHFQKKYSPNLGYLLSFIHPAIQRVQKTVNMMYGSGKGGLTVLLDRRYQDRRIMECFPPFYNIRNLESASDVSEIREVERYE